MRFDDGLGYNAPIEFSKLEKGYYYKDASYTIASVPLDDDDMNAIAFAAAILRQFKGVELIDNYAFAIDKIFDSVNAGAKGNNADTRSIIQVEQAPTVPGHHWLGQLLEAIKNRLVLDILYKSYISEAAKMYNLHPYFLKEYRNRWYVIGRDGAEAKVKTFGLDRIMKISDSDSVYMDDESFDAEIYFKHNIGITVGGLKPVDVVLSFNARQGLYIKSQPIHISQEIIQDTETELRVRVRVMINFEFIMLILGYGNDVEVISPKSFRETVKENMARTIKKYR